MGDGGSEGPFVDCVFVSYGLNGREDSAFESRLFHVDR